MKILLVEDSRILRDRMHGIIDAIPRAAVIAECDNEDSAVYLLDRHTPDVAVIDLRLGSGSGLSLIAFAAAQHPATTMIVLTNFAQPEYRAKCMKLGAHYFFDKAKDISKFAALLVDLSEAERAEGSAA